MSYQLSDTDRQILYATSVINAYGGIIMFSLGMIGNTLNILAFTCLKVYRSVSTATFLAAASLFGQIYLGFTLFRSSLADILQYNAAAKNLPVCRVVLFLSRVTVQISLTCLCFSAADRYLMTSRSARLRSLVTLTRARIAVALCVFVWCGYGVPSAIYALSNSFLNICVPTSDFSTTITYLNLVLSVLLPVFILSICGFLTWRNLGTTHLSVLNVQVTRMIFLDIIVVTISNAPLAGYLIYLVSQNKTGRFTAVETLLIYLAQLFSSAQFSVSFYCYLCISPTFRTNIKRMLLKMFCCRHTASSIEAGPTAAVIPVTKSMSAQ